MLTEPASYVVRFDDGAERATEADRLRPEWSDDLSFADYEHRMVDEGAGEDAPQQKRRR
eukprot:gene8212-12349_t